MAGLGAPAGGPMALKAESLGVADISEGSKALLNTYIHNYFVEEGLGEIARVLRDSPLQFNQKLLRKGGPVSDDTMDTDNNDNAKDGLPGSNNQAGSAGHNFLPNWWGIFYDMWSAARNKDKNDTPSAHYLAAIQRGRQQQANPALMQHSMINQNRFHQYQTMGALPNPINNLQKRAIANNNINPNINGNINNMRMQQHMAQQNQLQRDGSEMDMNGAPRGPSPRPGENAPSPKRVRVDSGASNFSRMGPNGRPVPMMPQPPNGNAPSQVMMMDGPFPAGAMSPAFSHLNGQAKSAEQQQYSQDLMNQQRAIQQQHVKIPGGMNQGSPMMPNGPDGALMDPSGMFQQNPNYRQPGIAGAAGHGGALADYQMQLMLLEQQNKKRLMMHRQELDVASRDQGVPPGLMGQSGVYAPPMSPRASRTGHSPNSNDPTKRGTPKQMGQDSPLPENTMGTNRNSPGSNNFEPGQMQNMMPPFAMVNGPVNGMMGRPPNGQNGQMSAQHVEMMRRQQQQAQMGMHNGAWPPGMQNPGQMLQQGQVMAQMDQARNSMPPPQGPPAGRTQPSSPQTQAAPPTPSQTSKAGPKKKDSKDNKKKIPKKAATTTGATPNAEVEQSDDIPPPTPSTPKNIQSGIIKGNAPGNMNMASQQPNPAMPAVMGVQQPMDNNIMSGPFGPMDTGNDLNAFTDNFEDLLGNDNTDVLQGFDFESFLHNDPVPLDFDTQYFGGDGLETGMGD